MGWQGHTQRKKGIIGTSVIHTARIEPVVNPGEVWVTDDFKNLLKDSRFAFDEIGVVSLAKQYGNGRLYRLRWEHESARKSFIASHSKTFNAMWLDSDASTIAEYAKKNSFFELSTQIDLWLYTGETFIFNCRQSLKSRDTALQMRLLIRRPEMDDKKLSMIKATIAAVQEIVEVNSKIDIQIRYYSGEPSIRMELFQDDTRGKLLIGAYRHRPMRSVEFVGAEDNKMIVLDYLESAHTYVKDIVKGRFEYMWNKCTPFRACLFDLDGVLVDSMSFHYAAWKEAIIRFGGNADALDFCSDVYSREGQKEEITARDFCDKYLIGKTPPISEIIKAKNEEYDRLFHRLSVFSGCYELLTRLKSRRILLALVTGSPERVATGIVNKWFPGIFDCIITGSDVERGKPDPQPYLTAASRLNLTPRECLVIENAPLGTDAGVKAGMQVVAVLMNSPLNEQCLMKAGASQVCKNIVFLNEYLEANFR